MAQVYGERWETVGSLGQGGQGHVFLVKDNTGQYEGKYVLKRLINQQRLERFRDEVEAVQRLEHPNILRLIDFSLEGTPPFLVTENCEGGDLTKAASPFWRASPLAALELFQTVCEAVSHAHNHGVIHRDLKPQNIYLRTPSGPAVVGDFGICHIEDDGARVTLTDEAVGSRFYIAPELADGRATRLDKRCDTYSLGKLLYWLLTNRVFDREKVRDYRYDLRGWTELPDQPWQDIHMEHINRLLDEMIVEDPEKRRYVGNVAHMIPRIIHLLKGGYNPIAPDLIRHQPCRYCGYGTYRLATTNNDAAANFGLEGRGAPDPRVLVCNQCGHVQLFRVDMASRKEWWGV